MFLLQLGGGLVWVSLLTSQVGGAPSHMGGTPFNSWIGGEEVVTLSQVAFYHLNMNGYRNVIFSVSLLTSKVGGWDPIPCGGTPFNSWIGGEGVVTLSQVAFYRLNMNGYRNVIFSVSLLTSQVGGGGGPHPTWGGPHPLYMRGCSLICGRQYLYSVHAGGHYYSNILHFYIC